MNSSDWHSLANDIGLDAESLVERARVMAEEAPAAFSSVANEEPVRALRSKLPGRLVDDIAAWTKVCRQNLERPARPVKR